MLSKSWQESWTLYCLSFEIKYALPKAHSEHFSVYPQDRKNRKQTDRPHGHDLGLHGNELVPYEFLCHSTTAGSGPPWLPLGMDPQGCYKLVNQRANFRGYGSWGLLWLVSCSQPPLPQSLVASSLENSLGSTLFSISSFILVKSLVHFITE